MDKLKLNLVNSYGIGRLDHEFDFEGFNSQLIYASNGVMKTSFANTFKALEKGSRPTDRLYNKPTTCEVTVDERPITRNQICVIKSFEDIDTKESQSKLLVDEDSKAEYDALFTEIQTEKQKLISDLNRDSGIPKKDIEQILLTDFNVTDFFDILQNFIDASFEQENFGVKYSDIFNSDVIQFLNTPDVQQHLQSYFNTYNQLINDSPIFVPGVFNTSKAENIKNALKKENFFHANHKIKLNGTDEEFTSDEQIEQFLLEQKRAILENADLKKIEEQVKKAAVHKFKEIIETHQILQELSNLQEFKLKLWRSYLTSHNLNIQFLLETYNTNVAQLREIEERAAHQVTSWDKVIDVFNNRFFVPFEAKIENKVSSILGKDVPTVLFQFTDSITGHEVLKSNDEFKQDEILSQGERRAMYLLNVIFKIEAYRNLSDDVLFIIDDIADSFDYRNKYAILQYLKDISETPLFKQIILTHNYDFFRTVQGRIFHGSSRRSNCFMAIRNGDNIILEAYGHNYQIDPFKNWRNNMSDKQKFVASIPFVRNLIEFQKDDNVDDFKALTSLLHIKTDTKNLTVGDVKTIFNDYIESTGIDALNPNEKVFDIIENEVTSIIENDSSSIELHKKVVLSIAIRLTAEDYVWSKVSDQTPFSSDQTYRLINRFKLEYSSTLSNQCEILDKVNLITPENIHLNSFMFEPILDLSIDHLISLYHEVKALNNEA